MTETSLVYIEKDEKYLMLHRTKKENDANKDKWIGIGGKFEVGESPFDCARREVLEETGLICKKLDYRGIITFVLEGYGTEYMHLFVTKDFSGQLLKNCDEGELEWISKKDLFSLDLWEGDKIFLNLIQKPCPFFSLKLTYDKENTLVSHTLDFAGEI